MLHTLIIPVVAVTAASFLNGPTLSLTLTHGQLVTPSAGTAAVVSGEADVQSAVMKGKVPIGPDLSSWRADGRPGSVRRRDTKTVHITPLRGSALTATAAGVTPRWCGASFQTETAPVQSLVLVGLGVTEALSCVGVKAFGSVPASRGVTRIAFMYSGSSPNASNVLTVVIVEWTSTSDSWAINEELSYKLDQRGNLTSISAVRAYLTKHHH
jgi:hypothetical protein